VTGHFVQTGNRFPQTAAFWVGTRNLWTERPSGKSRDEHKSPHAQAIWAD
jgi:hypothetical protein